MRTPTRFSGPALVATGPATVMTADELSVIRYLRVTNPSGGAVTFTMSIGADASGTRLFSAYSIPAGGELERHVYIVVANGETVQMAAGSNNVLIQSLHGDEIT